MSIKVQLKHSAVKDKAPVAADLSNGELALNINDQSPAAYIKDSAGNIVKLAGAGAAGDVWTRTGTAVSPTTTGDTAQISAGTAALPGLTPVGDPNTGVFSAGADQIGLATNGTGRLFVDASGRVSVNGSATSSVFEVVGTSATPTYKPVIQIDAESDSNPFVAMHRYIGTANQWRSIRQRIPDASGDLIVESSDSAAAIGSHTFTERFRISRNGAVEVKAAAATNPLRVVVGGSEVTRVDGSGRLLVGTTSTTATNSTTGTHGSGGVLQLGKGGLFNSLVARLQPGQYVDLTIDTTGTAIWTGFLSVTCSDLLNGTNRQYNTYAVNGANQYSAFTATSLASGSNGSGTSFSIAYEATGKIRITNDAASATEEVCVTYMGAGT